MSRGLGSADELVGHAAFKLLSSIQSSSLASRIAIVISLQRDPLVGNAI